ncbi:LuxR family transcriptional regulator [Microbacterium bovistercoris]|uniref:LuxR family transcriptional regulator n=1 Tax=Microbacterium bovistercoris TaxID=2293570 RepID=A0A371NRM2_9MICO|nr:LuxR family transcriptional regulator [Microbacterium bovistercoris]REJ04826.1 LuxR family transcriptional regulator [Microbacterium bovistercoris]
MDGGSSLRAADDVDAEILGRRGAVSRRSIIERSLSAAAFVVVTAPAGYGKSTLLREWAELDPRRPIVVSLGPFDNDPLALLASLAAAFAARMPGVGAFATLATQPASGPAVLGRLAPRLAATIAEVAEPFILLIDDLHEAATPSCQDVLEVALSRIPAGSQVVLAGRRPQPFLARIQPTGEVLHIGASHLRMDGEDARTVFDALASHGLTDDALSVLLERTEGWPTAIALAAIAAREGGDPLSILGDDRPVSEYLHRACFDRLGPDDQAFLRRTAILPEVFPECCDAVLGAQGSKGTLRALEDHGLFLTPLDAPRGAYRYHQLFREFLLDELSRVEPERKARLHLAAAEWYESAGMPSEAIDQLLSAGERERSVRMVAERAQSAYQAGQIAALERWMSALGEKAIRSYPPLLVLAGLRAVLDGNAPEADRWANIIEQTEDDAPAERGLPTYASGRAMLRAIMCRNGVASAARSAAYAVSCESPSSSWRDQALHLHGWMRQLSGDLPGAVAAYKECTRQAIAFGNYDSVLLAESELAVIALDAGSVAEAERHAEEAMAVIEAGGLHGYQTTCLALAVGARIALRRQDPQRAEQLLVRAMRDRGQSTYVTPIFAVKVRVELCRVFMMLGNSTTAAYLLDEIDDLLRIRPDLGTLPVVVAELRHSLDRSRALLGGSPLTPAEQRLLPYLQTHLTIAEIGTRLFVSRNTVSSQVASIYRKLDVTTRSEAVDRATEIGILG